MLINEMRIYHLQLIWIYQTDITICCILDKYNWNGFKVKTLKVLYLILKSCGNKGDLFRMTCFTNVHLTYLHYLGICK